MNPSSSRFFFGFFLVSLLTTQGGAFADEEERHHESADETPTASPSETPNPFGTQREALTRLQEISDELRGFNTSEGLARLDAEIAQLQATYLGGRYTDRLSEEDAQELRRLLLNNESGLPFLLRQSQRTNSEALSRSDHLFPILFG